MRDLLLTPPGTKRYDRLKQELIRRTSLSEQKRLPQLLISEKLGDRKPSQLHRRVGQLLGDNSLEEKIFKQLFLQSLPMHTQSILASMADMVDIEHLADKIIEVSPSLSAPVAAIAVPPPCHTPQASHDVLILQEQISALTKQVQALSTQLQHSNRNQSRGRPSSRTYPGDRSPSASSTGRTSAGTILRLPAKQTSAPVHAPAAIQSSRKTLKPAASGE